MSVTLAWEKGTLRFGPNHFVYGDDFAAVAQAWVDHYDRALIHVSGLAGKIEISDRNDLCRFLRTLGFTRMREKRRSVIKETDLTKEPFFPKVI